MIDQIRQTFEAHGFEGLETPAFEKLSTLTGKYGEEGDQLMYRLLKRRDALSRALEDEEAPPSASTLADLGLRYDLTVPFARVAAAYELPRFYRRHQIQPVWRADRPAKGRFREFYQCDIDLIGSKSILAEIEVLSAADSALTRLGFSEYTFLVNHRGLLREFVLASGLEPHQESDALIALDKLDKIGAEKVIEDMASRGISEGAARNLLRLCNLGTAEAGSTFASLKAEFPESESLENLEALWAGAADLGLHKRLRFSPQLARGLGYYTGPIFEIAVEGLKGSMGGGGRYDGLIGMFSGNEIPAVGFSLGLERILVVMEERDMFGALPEAATTLLCWQGVDHASATKAAAALRAQGYAVQMYPEEAKLKKQFQYANKIGASFAAVFGPDEAEESYITLKNLETGEQENRKLHED